MRRFDLILAAAATLAALWAPAASHAEDTLKLAVPQKGFWDTSVADFGQRAGFFKKEGLNLDILYTHGGADTDRAIFSGSVDIGIANGLLGVIGAYNKGVPVRVISSEFTGASDLFWYARTESGIKSLKDAAGKTMGFSSPGSSTNLVGGLLLKKAGVDLKFTPVGGPAASLTQVMSGQIDIGWATPLFVFTEIDQGKALIVARGSSLPEIANETIRVQVSTAPIVKAKHDLLVRFQRAYLKTIEWMYKDDQATKWFAEGANASEAQAKRARDQFFPEKALRLGAVHGMDLAMKQAIDFKRLEQPLTKAQIAELMAIVPASAPK
jgi:NitT/TauT family transport system substrate-binding protein